MHARRLLRAHGPAWVLWVPGLGICEVNDCRLWPVLAPQLRVVLPDGLLGVEGVRQRPPRALQQVQQVCAGDAALEWSELNLHARWLSKAACGQMQDPLPQAFLEVAIQKILLRVTGYGHSARQQQGVKQRQLSARGRHQKEACRAEDRAAMRALSCSQGQACAAM